MKSLFFSQCTFVLVSAMVLSSAIAQEANVLGLPAIPQPKPGAAGAAPAAKAASAPQASSDTPVGRDVIAGEMGLQHSAINGTGRIVFTTKASFATAGARSNAIDAARSVQRELGKSCGKQCKPVKMSAPKILPSGQMEFELAFSPLYQHLNQAQFLAALQSTPFNLTPAQLTAPSIAPAVSVSIGTPTAAPPATTPPTTATQ